MTGSGFVGLLLLDGRRIAVRACLIDVVVDIGSRGAAVIVNEREWQVQERYTEVLDAIDAEEPGDGE